MLRTGLLAGRSTAAARRHPRSRGELARPSLDVVTAVFHCLPLYPMCEPRSCGMWRAPTDHRARFGEVGRDPVLCADDQIGRLSYPSKAMPRSSGPRCRAAVVTGSSRAFRAACDSEPHVDHHRPDCKPRAPAAGCPCPGPRRAAEGAGLRRRLAIGDRRACFLGWWCVVGDFILDRRTYSSRAIHGGSFAR